MLVVWSERTGAHGGMRGSRSRRTETGEEEGRDPSRRGEPTGSRQRPPAGGAAPLGDRMAVERRSGRRAHRRPHDHVARGARSAMVDRRTEHRTCFPFVASVERRQRITRPDRTVGSGVRRPPWSACDREVPRSNDGDRRELSSAAARDAVGGLGGSARRRSPRSAGTRGRVHISRGTVICCVTPETVVVLGRRSSHGDVDALSSLRAISHVIDHISIRRFSRHRARIRAEDGGFLRDEWI